jgi:GNAT superfamily N-acetyltransferase
MIVQIACTEDIPAWITLAREVEGLFGAEFAESEEFEVILRRKIDEGLALCVREQDGPPGTPLCGGLFFSIKHRPVYKIGWLAVAEKWKRCGVGQALVERALEMVEPPAEVTVVTFTAETPGGEPARRFYERLGFAAAELLPGEGPNGEMRQVYRLLCE